VQPFVLVLSRRRAPAIAFALALAPFVLVAPSVASAQAQGPTPLPPSPCPRGQICAPTPPGPAPALTPALDAQLRARAEQETRARVSEQAYREAAANELRAREYAFQERAEAARPRDVPVRTPLVETSLGMRVGFLGARRDYVHVGPELGVAYRIDDIFTVDVPVALLRASSDLGTWATLATRPSLMASVVDRGILLYARSGPDVMLPLGTRGAAPDALVGLHLGVGLGYLAAPLGNGGYAAIILDVDGALRAGVGGPSSPLDTLRVGYDFTAGMRLAF
jgi:hypothetical protein